MVTPSRVAFRIDVLSGNPEKVNPKTESRLVFAEG